MPGDDLLRFLGGPLPLAWWWPVLAVLLVVVTITWCVGVMLWTLPPHRLRAIPGLRSVHAALVRRRFLRSIRATTQKVRDRTLTPQEASTAYDRILRSFLFVRTGVRAQYLHLTDLEVIDSHVGRAVPLLAVLDDIRFNTQTRSDVVALGHQAERLVSTWT
ncbi:hypothetical protein FK535_26095 [Mycolicibacterium sp. 018/SC-01/001]|uniref:hypothetical protein n=1 Tax=Mycolicibacterium sp. 018/SC-01/001 TaxID=2592069 RepID=UPI00118002B8|nr:hypothetical protein [Mycolicibacterium sp. 018/SC-01/001]TRW78232.1 hypothetical protein FK535_26095 [Mycolicibacterium sp. 018/SC-01/001]